MAIKINNTLITSWNAEKNYQLHYTTKSPFLKNLPFENQPPTYITCIFLSRPTIEAVILDQPNSDTCLRVACELCYALFEYKVIVSVLNWSFATTQHILNLVSPIHNSSSPFSLSSFSSISFWHKFSVIFARNTKKILMPPSLTLYAYWHCWNLIR